MKNMTLTEILQQLGVSQKIEQKPEPPTIIFITKADLNDADYNIDTTEFELNNQENIAYVRSLLHDIKTNMKCIQSCNPDEDWETLPIIQNMMENCMIPSDEYGYAHSIVYVKAVLKHNNCLYPIDL